MRHSLKIIFPPALALGLILARSASAAPITPTELLASPDQYLGKSVEVRIVEPLYGPSTEAALKSVEYGQMEVMMPDVSGKTLDLVPSAFKPEDPNRFKKKFDRVIASPLTVKGDILKDAEMTESMNRPYYVIRVASWEPLNLGEPTAVKSLDQIKADPAKWDRKPVVYEGTYESRFEVSALDRDIWLQFQPNTQITNRPNDKEAAHKVRVTGILFSKPGSRYGHLSGYSFEILASKLEFN